MTVQKDEHVTAAYILSHPLSDQPAKIGEPFTRLVRWKRVKPVTHRGVQIDMAYWVKRINERS